jgi:hypothetical protein
MFSRGLATLGVIVGFCAAATVAQGLITFGGASTRQDRLAADIGTIFGTYQSMGNRVAYVPGGGIFVAYLAHWVNDDKCVLAAGIPRSPLPLEGLRDGCKNEMVIARSLDDGVTFTPLMKINLGAQGPPVLYADMAGDVIAVVAGRMDSNRNDTWVYKFPAGDWHHPVLLGTIYYGWDSKYTADVSPQDTLWYLHGGPGPTAPWGNTIMMTRAKIGWGNDTTGTTRWQAPTSTDCFCRSRTTIRRRATTPAGPIRSIRTCISTAQAVWP